MATHTSSQRYLSTRGGSYGFSFEDVVLKGLAQDGGLFIPEEVPSLPADWQTKWKDCSFQELAFNIFSFYISPDEISSEDLRQIINKSYATFRDNNITPNVTLDTNRNIHLLELFHGPVRIFRALSDEGVADNGRHLLSRTSPFNS
jgi:threonine synthase